MADAIRNPATGKGGVLIVNDEADSTRLVLQALAGRGVHGTVLRSLTGRSGAGSAETKLTSQSYDMLLADVSLAGEGLELISAIRRRRPEMPVVLMGHGVSLQAAVRAMQLGAADVLDKPLTRKRIEAMLDAHLPGREASTTDAEQQNSVAAGLIAGTSRRLRDVVDTARRIAVTSVPVLITGESGTGKELLSRLIHSESRRAAGPFVAVNCGALSESLLESELFGHERGAFTGADARRTGRFERADGGTLMLDEVSETGPRLQAELLRVLEQQNFERLGGSESIRVDVRVISTSNRDLQAEVENGRFRRDLYYRLCGVRIAVPPLRDRLEDIQPLVWHFVRSHAGEVGRNIARLDQEMLNLFRRCAWPGNVRQLRNVVRAALVLGEGPVLSLAGAPCVMGDLHADQKTPPTAQIQDAGATSSLSLADIERQAIFEALRRTRSHQARAAELLGITDRTLREKLKRYRRQGQTPTGPEPVQPAEPCEVGGAV